MTPIAKQPDFRLVGRVRGAIVAMAAAALFVAGCSVETGKRQAFENFDRLEKTLKPVRTTKADILLQLGEPDGVGGFGGFASVRRRLGSDAGPEQAWYYENVTSRIGLGSSSAEQHQNLLLIFFNGDTYAGHFWVKNAVGGTTKWN